MSRNKACLASIAATGLLFSACADSGTTEPRAPGGHIEVAVAPLSLIGIGDVTYKITVANAASPIPETVFDVTASSSRFGDGVGSISYVGPCDASANPNRVTIEIVEMVDVFNVPLADTEWRNPTPVSLSLDCQENADVAATFNLTIVRSANQGFFDVAVQFSDIFCSAKLDCVDAFLHNGLDRDTTAIVAWACTSGEGQDTWLHMDPVIVACDDGTQFTVSPGGPIGNRGGLAPYFFQSAVYRDRESLPNVDKCSWSTAIGIDTTALPADINCALTAAATASEGPWAGGNTPAGRVYPSIHWDLPLVTDGALVCGQHALDAPGSGVETRYTSIDGSEHFAFSMECAEDAPVVASGAVCQTAVGGGDSVEFIPSAGGQVVVLAGDRKSAPMQLPAGLSLDGACCQDLCCMP